MWFLLIGVAVGFIGYLTYFLINRIIDKKKNNNVETATDE